MKALFAFFILLAGSTAFAGNTALEGQLTSGVSHTCTLNQGKVQCWGGNEFGQSKVPELRNPKMVSAGYHHTCALDDAGVKCWGLNSRGQTNVPPFKNPRYVAAGKSSSCAIDDEGVKCWWYNKEGESQPPPRLKNPRMLSVGEDRACAITDSGLACWGKRFDGYMRPLVNPRYVSVGKHVCALDDQGATCSDYEARNKKWVAPQGVIAGPNGQCVQDEGKITCWSDDPYFRFDPWSEFPAPPLRNLAHFSLGTDHACALGESGIQCWGYGYTNVPRLSKPRHLTAGSRTACAEFDEGVKCWGYAEKGMNERMPEFRNLTSLSASSGLLCAIDDQGPRCFGADSRYNLVAPPAAAEAREIRVGRDLICATTPSSVVCWRQMGAVEPIVAPIQDPQSFIYNWESACALSGGKLKCWKHGDPAKAKEFPFGVRAIASGEYSSTLVNDQDQLMMHSGHENSWYLRKESFPLSGTRALSTGEQYTCAIDSTGVKCLWWGAGKKNEAVLKVPPLRNPEALVSGSQFACAIDGGKVECWGQGFERVREVPAIR